MITSKQIDDLWTDIVNDRAILRGDEVSDGAPWQDVAGTMAVNLRVLANKLDALRNGERAEPFLVLFSRDD